MSDAELSLSSPNLSPTQRRIHEDDYFSPSSPIEELSDPNFGGPRSPPAPIPGVNAPVRWFDADRTEPYTHTVPFDSVHDSSVEFVFNPITLSVLAIAMSILAYVGMTDDVLEEGRDKTLLGIYATIVAFLTFCMVQFRDGPFIRPHPAFWRIVLGLNLLYELCLVFLLFQDLPSARRYMVYIDPNLGKPLQDKSYAEDCSLTYENLWDAVDIFALAHFLGWLGKALILRDYWFCWILSISFELAEYSLAHQLPNFKECWWDHWVLDVLMCNWAGTYLGMKLCQYFEVKKFVWRGAPKPVRPGRGRGLRRKAGRVLKQLTPHDWTTFKWEGTASFTHYAIVVTLLALFLAAELNPFYLKSLLWMEPDHPIIIARLAGVFLCALPAVRELYEYCVSPHKVARMGQHAWLLLATMLTELLIIFKWGRGQYPNPFPTSVKIGWSIGITLLVLYPTFKFGVPQARRYLRKLGKKDKRKPKVE